jgi:pentapeptide MXKDX repeat protein
MLKSAVLTLFAAVAFSGTAFAAMMTDSEKITMQQCQSMSPSAMKSDKNCAMLMKKYPSAMKGDSMNKGGMDNNSMSK